MNEQIARWAERFQRLNPNPAQGFPAPHKPLLLLSVLDLVEDGTLRNREVRLTPELIDAFQTYWKALFPAKPGLIFYPFFHLRTSGFWDLVAQPGAEERLRYTDKVRSVKAIRELIDFARIDPELWAVMQDPVARASLRAALIAAYFDPGEREVLAGSEQERRAVAQYRQRLLGPRSPRFELQQAPAAAVEEKVRTSGFRTAIQRVYDHTCAFCGLRIVTPTGATALEAAHIVPFCVSFNDDPRNGLGLCPLHHWAFDEGLVSCEQKTEMVIIVSPLLDLRRPTEDRLCSLQGQRVLLPRDGSYRPAEEALYWHNRNVLLR